jgi:hypothetical protein
VCPKPDPEGRHHTKFKINFFSDSGAEGHVWFTKQVFDYVPGMGFIPKDGKLLAELATLINRKTADDEFEANFEAPTLAKKAKTDATAGPSDPSPSGSSTITKKAGPANKFLKPFDMKGFSSIWASKGQYRVSAKATCTPSR